MRDQDGDTIMAGTSLSQNPAAIVGSQPTNNNVPYQKDSDGDVTMSESVADDGAFQRFGTLRKYNLDSKHAKRRFPFLRLPGELRNRIYFYILTAKNGRLRYLSPGPYNVALLPPLWVDRPVPMLLNGGVELNQIKYTCRQIYKEARGLELRYNDIAFLERSSTKKASEYFLDFVVYLGPSAKWITNVTIKAQSSARGPDDDDDWHLEPVDRFIAIAGWCKSNPQATVHYFFEDLCYEDVGNKASLWGFLLRAHFISLALRDVDSNLLIPGAITGTKMQNRLRKLRTQVNQFLRNRSGARHTPAQWECSRFRFFPAKKMGRDPDRVVRSVMKRWNEAYPGQTKETRHRIVSHLLEWYQMGF
ncbi:hypothetical protein K491DRAFT_683734 [Lophiostoma macrostomum CBS 122681]|uniref:Uncharacterized protein n=1 Tax=Lophiostoma macrostomum CBS 122681 TaxID=1314788 RepID=A0A6A6SPD1_9PLEO|nr:hypothetical protein K491DRAFT_683734 [Lophiostoma macrostomum CBS 122681]